MFFQTTLIRLPSFGFKSGARHKQVFEVDRFHKTIEMNETKIEKSFLLFENFHSSLRENWDAYFFSFSNFLSEAEMSFLVLS